MNDIPFHISISPTDVCYISVVEFDDFSYSLFYTLVRPTVGEDENVTYILRNDACLAFLT